MTVTGSWWVHSGGKAKTSNYTITFWWPPEGDSRDFAYHSKVGTWIGQNARVLDKKSAPECVKLVAEQFPEVKAIEVCDHQNRMARMSR